MTEKENRNKKSNDDNMYLYAAQLRATHWLTHSNNTTVHQQHDVSPPTSGLPANYWALACPNQLHTALWPSARCHVVRDNLGQSRPPVLAPTRAIMAGAVPCWAAGLALAVHPSLSNSPNTTLLFRLSTWNQHNNSDTTLQVTLIISEPYLSLYTRNNHCHFLPAQYSQNNWIRFFQHQMNIADFFFLHLEALHKHTQTHTKWQKWAIYSELKCILKRTCFKETCNAFTFIQELLKAKKIFL